MKRVTLNVLETPSRAAVDFNPHPHEEGDANPREKFIWSKHFNPHPHEEGDILEKRDAVVEEISIHTLTKRVTPPPPPTRGKDRIFNPHPHEEGDLLQRAEIASEIHFNPHPHEEGDF